jgi:serine/threonine protein kinase
MNAAPEPEPIDERLAEVLAAYLEAADAGWAPDRQAFVARYPGLTSELEAFFRDQDQVVSLVGSLPSPQGGVGVAEAWHPADGPTLPHSEAWCESTDLNLKNVRFLGDYEIIGEVAHGGMGVVFKARQRGLNRLVALKMIRAGALASPAEVERFRREAENASRLDHPNIVPIHTVGEERGQHYFTMRLIEGGNLNQHLPRLARDLKAGVRILITVAQAVHYAHQRGILHRDLKPANILLDGKDQPHITDFGLAKRFEGAADAEGTGESNVAGYVAPEQADGASAIDSNVFGQALTLSAVAGTPSYMPPEQADREKGVLTTAADVYGLGAILYKLLTGQPPFRGDTWKETLRMVREEAPVPPRQLQPRVSRDLEAVCMKCLAKKPEERYPSAKALADDLERWLAGEPVQARRRSWPARAWRRVYRNALLCAVVAVAAFTAGSAFGIWYWMNPERPLKNNLRRLEHGEKVTLIGDTGQPAWYELLPHSGTVMVSPAPEQPFGFTSLIFGRLQLLTAVPCESYRMSAEVRHDDYHREHDDSSTGIFFAHQTMGQCTFWCELVFADIGPGAHIPGHMTNDSARVRFLLYRSVAGPNPEKLASYDEKEASTMGAWFQPEADSWRRVTVEVGPDRIRAWWGGTDGTEEKPLGEISRAELEKLASDLDNQDFGPSCPFFPRGSVGLVVHRGTASFRRVTVEPLP